MPGTAPPLDNEADEALMLRYAAGDIAAFDTLYLRHELGVWRYLLRSVRVQAVADDLLQDVWFAVARSAAAYQVRARFKTWLFTLAHNRLVDHFRTARNHLSLDGGSDSGDDDDASLADTLAADSGFGPVRQLQSREQAAALIAAIERLPAEQREAFLLQAEAGLSVEEIASATGVTFETAKSRLRYARSSLKQWLQEFA
jgi:RNA polymerase sigma-70 factor (ECF subfamily)